MNCHRQVLTIFGFNYFRHREDRRNDLWIQSHPLQFHRQQKEAKLVSLLQKSRHFQAI